MDKKLKNYGIAAFIAGILAALLEAVFLERYFFKVETFDIGKRNSAKKIKIVLLTDLHFRKSLWSFHIKLADTINNLKPDLILISGDVIDETGKSADAATKFLKLINLKIPKAAILGNHDHTNVVSINSYVQMFNQSNCAFLMNKSKEFFFGEEKIMVTGVDDFIEGDPCFADAVRNVGREENHLLLVHSPLQLKKVKKEIKIINALRSEKDRLNIQYAFAGHNHGGQVKIFDFAPIMPKKSGNYMSGWYNKQPPYLYVSNGFGTSGLPFRFGARAEVTVFNYGV